MTIKNCKYFLLREGILRLLVFLFLTTILLPNQADAQEKKPRVASTPVVEVTGKKPEDEDFGYIETEGDPVEPVNRGIFSFNQGIDDAAIKPLARGYESLVSDWGRERVGNFFDNLQAPVSFLNSLLQGDPQNALAVFWRFVINTTIGLGGIYDTAEEAGLSARKEDFGQTIGVYNENDPGAYVVLPILGPSSTRDTVGFVVDTLTNPFNYLPGAAVAGLVVSEGIHDRADILELTDEIEQTSFDPYSTYRSAYIQHRADEVSNGKNR